MINENDTLQHPKNWRDAMKQEMDLCRDILLEIEKVDTPRIVDFSSMKYPVDQINYHISLLHNIGYIQATQSIDITTGLEWIVMGDAITWDGHDFLNASRNDTIWQKAKETLISKGGSYTIEALKLILNELVKQYLLS